MEALIFVDTSALFAVVDLEDHQHQAAYAKWRELIGDNQHLITTNYVVVELFTLAQNRLGFDAVRELEADMFPLLDIILVEPSVHRAAVGAVLAAGRRKLSSSTAPASRSCAAAASVPPSPSTATSQSRDSPSFPEEEPA